MLIGRFLYKNKVCFGSIEGHDIHLLRENIFSTIEPSGERLSLADIALLPPVQPPLIIGLGRNYTSHVEEMAVEPPDRLAVFFKPGRSIIGRLSNPVQTGR